MQDWIVPAAAAALALVALALGVALLRARSRTDRELAAARAETALLRSQVDELERRVARAEPRTTGETEFVITSLGDPESAHAEHPEHPEGPQVGGALFADLVLRETVVKAAGLAHGVRRALDPETRNRIRFEMRREVRRARKQRKVDTREARRDWAARQRAGLDGESTKDTAA
jgi:type IV secretory pathway VirB10-like protein